MIRGHPTEPTDYPRRNVDLRVWIDERDKRRKPTWVKPPQHEESDADTRIRVESTQGAMNESQ